MESKWLPLDDGEKQSLAAYIRYAAQDLGLPENHETVIKHARLLKQNSELWDQNAELLVALDKAEKDPLTGYWLRGPGFIRLNEMISIVENKQDGLIDGSNAPNAIFGLGVDLEALHYTNSWYGQEAGDTRLIEVGREIASVTEILKETVRKSDRREQTRGEDTPRPADILIRTGGDEFMAAFGVNLTPEHDEELVANAIVDRIKTNKDKSIPGSRIIFMGGFWRRGQSAEDFYYSVEPKAQMARAKKLARPVIKIARLGLGQYKPSQDIISEL